MRNSSGDLRYETEVLTPSFPAQLVTLTEVLNPLTLYVTRCFKFLNCLTTDARQKNTSLRIHNAFCRYSRLLATVYIIMLQTCEVKNRRYWILQFSWKTNQVLSLSFRDVHILISASHTLFQQEFKVNGYDVCVQAARDIYKNRYI